MNNLSTPTLSSSRLFFLHFSLIIHVIVVGSYCKVRLGLNPSFLTHAGTKRRRRQVFICDKTPWLIRLSSTLARKARRETGQDEQAYRLPRNFTTWLRIQIWPPGNCGIHHPVSGTLTRAAGIRAISCPLLLTWLHLKGSRD